MMAAKHNQVEHLVGAHEGWASNGAAAAPAWLKEVRSRGIARFRALGFPTTKNEAWRFTSVAPLAETTFDLPHLPKRVPALDDIRPLLLGTRSRRLVFLNGFFQRALSTPVSDGVRLDSLAAALSDAPDLVRTHLCRYATFEDRTFCALNTAFVQDGAFVYVPSRATVEEPIELLFLTDGQVITQPRNLIVVEREARATVVETYASLNDGTYWTNAVTEIAAGDGARIDHHRVQRESPRAFHLGVTDTHQGRDSTVHVHAVAFGSALARHDLGSVMAGTNGTLILNGLYLLNGEQHVDHHTQIDHAAPHCESHEYFNGVLDGKSRGVFTGRIIVRPGAQKTDSKQTNNNLLLSSDAHADSQPQLEIYADDVKCTHGSTVGPLDPRALFYLRSRGVGEREARRLLTYGFSTEILARMSVAPLREQLDRVVRDRLAAL